MCALKLNVSASRRRASFAPFACNNTEIRLTVLSLMGNACVLFYTSPKGVGGARDPTCSYLHVPRDDDAASAGFPHILFVKVAA